MKTEGVIRRGEKTTITECGVFDDALKRSENVFLPEHNTDGELITKSSCGETQGFREVTQLTDEGNVENSSETLESETEKIGRETLEEENMYVDCGRSEDEATHYAEILTTKPCKTTISMVRRTRESNNPILRLCYGEQDSLSADSTEDCEQRVVSQEQHTMYENTQEQGNLRRGIHHTLSDSEIFYVNTSSCEGSPAKRDNSHVYVNFDNDQQETRMTNASNNETSDTESLYEDIDDVYEAMSPSQCASKPIGIVYASMDFSASSNAASPSSVDSCPRSSSFGSLERPELHKSATYSSGNQPLRSDKPPELPRRTSNSLNRRARPNSLHFGSRHEIAEFGLYTGTLVGRCTLMKSSPKSVQHIVGDFLAREKKERSKPVSLEVTGEFIRLSLNCAPWSLLAQSTLDDIGCVTTVCANNKTALGYTVSKPGENTYCYVLHCSDVEAIKESILSMFKRPDPSISRWSSMCSLGTPSKSMSLPNKSRLRSMSRHNEIAIFDDLVYLGSYKVKKSYLVVNDNIATVLDHTDSKHYTFAKVELYKDAIHLKDSKMDRILDIHQLDWILSMGLFDEDRRYFGYISSKAFQGSKTRTFCHVFRCTRVGCASRILETIRQACQATFLARSPQYGSDFRPRTNSGTSTSSEGSMSSSSETMSMGSTSSSPPEIDGKSDFPTPVRRRLRLLGKKARVRLSTIRSFAENATTNDILEEKAEELDASTKPTKPMEHRFNVFYLCSTIVSPPLKPKHVKECLRQYQKAVDKAMKKTNNPQHYKKVQLVVNQDGVMIVDHPTQPPQAFFERATLASVQGHPEGKCAFAFSTFVSGNTKHKCHLFLQDKEPMEEIIGVIQSQIQQK